MSTLTAMRPAALVAAELGQPWRKLSACEGRSALMDPPGGLDGEANRDARNKARAICDRCPVLADCEAWVMSLTEQHDPGGMCAAMTARQRKSRRRAASKNRFRKTCRRCGLPRPVEQFYTSDRSPDGRRASCKKCEGERAKARREERASERERLAAMTTEELLAETIRSLDGLFPTKKKGKAA